jgi:hypothetical protein
LKQVYIVILFSLAFALPLRAQEISVSYSPTSIQFWGGTVATQKIDFRYSFVQFSLIDVNDTRFDELDDPVRQTNFAIFLAPKLRRSGWFISAGAGYFFKRFANDNGTYFNFLVEAGKTIQVGSAEIGIKYSHISNADRGTQNHGLDNISLSLGFFFD